MLSVRPSRRSRRHLPPIVVLALATSALAPSFAPAQDATLATSSDDYEISDVRSDIGLFSLNVVLDAPLVAGTRYENPPIRRLDYRVVGLLEAGTPSGFESFDLQRGFAGGAFYAQGGSLSFEIAETAVLDDGVQVAELVGEDVVLLFDGREIGTGRFHPARLELRADGSGRLQNSNNQPGDDPASTIEAGAEYVTDLLFDPGNTTVLRVAARDGGSSGGGAAVVAPLLLSLLLLRRRRSASASRARGSRTSPLPAAPSSRSDPRRMRVRRRRGARTRRIAAAARVAAIP